MADYENYIKFTVTPNSVFEFENLKLTNDSDDEYHMFLKKVDLFSGEIIDMEEDKMPIEHMQQALDLNHRPAVSADSTDSYEIFNKKALENPTLKGALDGLMEVEKEWNKIK
jgi:hypothetical protein